MNACLNAHALANLHLPVSVFSFTVLLYGSPVILAFPSSPSHGMATPARFACPCCALAIPAEVCADEQHSCMCVAYRLSPKLASLASHHTTEPLVTWPVHLRLTKTG